VNEVFATAASVTMIENLFYFIFIVIIVECRARARRFTLREHLGIVDGSGFQ
jgi:hypothetical protein